MPLYEYQCQSCESSFSELRRSSEMDETITCPDCGGVETHRILSGFAVGNSTRSHEASVMPCGAPNAAACGRDGFSCPHA